MTELMKKGFLSGNQLKVIALVAMTVDHIGVYLFPDINFLRIIGRLAFPIFAYMIAEGCTYTRKRGRYISLLALVAAACQIVLFAVTKSLFQCIFVTFTISVAMIYLLDNARQKNSIGAFAGLCVGMAGTYFVTEIMPGMLKNTDFAVDYGFYGVAFPIVVYVASRKRDKLLGATIVLCMLGLKLHPNQWYALFAVPVLALYNGKRGKLRLKTLFYVYYPLHLAVIFLIGMLMKH